MKVILINPNSRGFSDLAVARLNHKLFLPTEISPHLGLGYLASSLEKRGLSCQIIDADLLDLKIPQIVEAYKFHQPDFVGITLLHDVFPQGISLIKKLKEVSRVPIVVGGHLPTIAAEHLFELVPEIDYALIGEAENSIVDFVTYFNNLEYSLHKIPNMIFRAKDGRIKMTELSPPSSLRNLPYPQLNDIETVFRLQDRYKLPRALRIPLSRGCKGRCQFCSIHAFSMHLGNFLRWRMRPIQEVVDEIAYLHEKYKVRLFYFSDDNFAGHLEDSHFHMELLAQSIIDRHLDIRFSVSCRIDQFSYKAFALLKKAGLIHVGVGLENISNKALGFFKKGYTNEVALKFLEGMAQLNVSISLFMIIYHPLATFEEIYQNYLFLQKLGYFKDFNKERNAYDLLISSRLIVRRFTPIEKVLFKRGLHRGYMKNNPFLVKYDFINPKVGEFWNELYNKAVNNEDKVQNIFLNLLGRYMKSTKNEN